MQKFKQYIIEQEFRGHMTHIEDMVWDSGMIGTRQAVQYLRTLRDQLAGRAPNAMNLSVKWDGAPAIFAGTDPSDGKFFVAKKGIFNKNPKVYKTDSDIDADTSGELNDKLKQALKHLPALGIKGVVQGDFLFAKQDVKEVVIDGTPHISFHPNTIVYTIPKDSQLAKTILASEIGVVWHTSYAGKSFETMSASFGKEIASAFRPSRKVWSVDAVFKDVSGQATFTKAETTEVTKILNSATSNMRMISRETFATISSPDINAKVNTFINKKVRQNERVRDAKSFSKDLKQHLHDFFAKEEEARKSEKGKAAVREKRGSMLSKVEAIPVSEFEAMVNLYNNIVDVKHMIIKKLDQASSVGTFLKTTRGLEVTAPEGYVAVDRRGKNALKLVDRLQFSKSNFSADIIKGWTK